MPRVRENGALSIEIGVKSAIVGALALAAALAGASWAMVTAVFHGYEQRLADAGVGIQNNAAESAAIRAFAESQNATLRAEFDASRKDLGDQLQKLGDRLVAANDQTGDRIDRLRTELVGAMDKRDAEVGSRFDRLEQKMDTMLTRITFEPAIQAPAGTYMIDEKGNVRSLKGELLGKLPAVFKPSSDPLKP